MTAPLLVIGLDGADDRILAELMAAERLPALAALRARGALVEVDTRGDLLPEAVWPTLVAGTELGEHRLFHFYGFDPETMGLRFRREVVDEVEPFWLHLPGRGARALVVDVPEVHVHPESHADEACCWHKHAPAHAPYFTSREVERALRPAAPLPPLRDPDYSLPPSLEHDASVSDRLARSAVLRGRALRSAATGRPAVLAVFHELHNAVHALGHHYDPEHWYRPFEPVPELVFNVYEAVDAALAPLLEDFREANVAVVAVRGIRPTDTAGDLLEELLARGGLLARAGEGAEVATTERVRRLIPGDVRRRVAARLLPARIQHRLAARAFRERYAWPATRAFSLPTWTTGLVRVNLAGREVAGVVPADELEPVLEEATRLILETVDAATGTPLAARVHRVQHDTASDPGPDLLVEWTPGRPPRVARHPSLGTWELDRRHGHAWSHHRGEGLVVLAGPGVRNAPEPLAEDMLGLAATLLSLAGVRAPAGSSRWSDVVAG